MAQQAKEYKVLDTSDVPELDAKGLATVEERLGALAKEGFVVKTLLTRAPVRLLLERNVVNGKGGR